MIHFDCDEMLIIAAGFKKTVQRREYLSLTHANLCEKNFLFFFWSVVQKAYSCLLSSFYNLLFYLRIIFLSSFASHSWPIKLLNF